MDLIETYRDLTGGSRDISPTKKGAVRYDKTIRFRNADGQPLTGPNSVMDGSPDHLTLSETFTASITNQEATASGTGEGSTGVGT